jgi:hypothetical protein
MLSLNYSRLITSDDKLKAIVILITLPNSWETIVVSLSNHLNSTFDGVRDFILNEDQKKI